jgi:hypothetical protein
MTTQDEVDELRDRLQVALDALRTYQLQLERTLTQLSSVKSNLKNPNADLRPFERTFLSGAI